MSPRVGEVLKVVVSERKDKFVAMSPDHDVEFAFIGDPPTETGEIEVSVEKIWYTPSGDVQTVFITPTNGEERRKKAREKAKENPLNDLASKLVDEEIKEREKETSAIGEAKRRARKQGRDPAVDPKLGKK